VRTSTITTLAGLSILMGAWELALTRLASLYFFFDVAYLAIACCLFLFGIGALWARRYGQSLSLIGPTVILIAMLPVSWCAIAYYEIAWMLLLFAWPFALYGAASTIAWHRMRDARSRSWLYSAELAGLLIGLVIAGPAVMSSLPMDVFDGPGIETHLRHTVDREGLAHHESSTSAYARTDLVQTTRDSVAYLFTDGMFVTRSVRWDGKSSTFTDPYVEYLAQLKRLALMTSGRDRVLLLGAGAGFDLAVALQTGADHIDAVEVNDDTLSYARSLDDWAGGVMENPAVDVHLAEARRFVAGTDERWNHINLTLMQTSPALGRGRSHIDGRVLTVEAIRSYLDHLEPNGVVSIIQNLPELAERTRWNVLTAIEGDATRMLEWHLVPGDEHNPFAYLLVVRNEPFTDTERRELADVSRQFNVVQVTADRELDAAPVTDDRPFLFEMDLRMYGYAVIASTLALCGLLGLTVAGRNAPGQNARVVAGTITGAVTMGIQVLVVYRMQTALGVPSLAFGLGLAAVLGGAGLGALLLGRTLGQAIRWRECATCAAAGVAALTIVGPPLAEFCMGIDTGAAGLIMTLFIGACCLPTGLPFLALIDACHSLPGRGEGIAIGSDGLGGIIGAAGATAIAMLFGFSVVGWVLVVGFVLFAWARPQRAG
jgi:spermidine synthase